MKIETQTEAQKIQEVYYVTDEASSSEEVQEHEDLVEEHAHVSYEEQQHITELSLTQVDMFGRLQTSSEAGQMAESRDDSSSDLSKSKDTRSIKCHIIPKTEAVVQNIEAKKHTVTVSDKQSKDKSLLDEGVFVRKIEFIAEAILDERKDITLIEHLKQVPKPVPTGTDADQETGFNIPTESRPKSAQQVEIRLDTAEEHSRIRQERAQRTGSAEVSDEIHFISTESSPMKIRTIGENTKQTLQELVADIQPKARGTELTLVTAEKSKEDEATSTTKEKSKMEEDLVESSRSEGQVDEVQILQQADAQTLDGTNEAKPVMSNAEQRKKILATEVSSRGTKNIPCPSYLHPDLVSYLGTIFSSCYI